MAAEDRAIVEQLHQQVSAEDRVTSHEHHEHIAAVFAAREAAQDAVDELRHQGLGSRHLGLAVRQDASARVFERDADAEVMHDTATGVAAGAAMGFLAGMSIAAIALVPGGVIGLGGILAVGAGSGVGGAMLGGYLRQATAHRAFDEHEELSEIHLDPGQVLVVACSHGRPGRVEEVMERHGGELVLRPHEP